MKPDECEQCGKNDDGGLYEGVDKIWRCCSCIMHGQEEAIKKNPEYYSQILKTTEKEC